MDQLKTLSRIIDIVCNYGHAVSVSAQKAIGNVGPNVSFGCDAGGAFVRLYDGKRISVEEAKHLAADLLKAIHYASHREWLCDHGMAIRDDG